MLSKFIARRAKRVVVISQGLRLAYERIGIAAEKIIVAPDGIDLEAFAQQDQEDELKKNARATLVLPSNKKIVLYIGRLDGWKGVRTLFEAAEFLSDDIQVVIIGGEEEQIKVFKEKYPKVTFLGYRPYRELPRNQRAADVLVLPNTGKDADSAHYTSPLKLFSYMASLRPIVAADLPSLREVIDDSSAYFFTPDDARALARAITEALEHPDLATAKAFKARKLVERYSWNARAHHILSALENLS